MFPMITTANDTTNTNTNTNTITSPFNNNNNNNFYNNTHNMFCFRKRRKTIQQNRTRHNNKHHHHHHHHHHLSHIAMARWLMPFLLFLPLVILLVLLSVVVLHDKHHDYNNNNNNNNNNIRLSIPNNTTTPTTSIMNTSHHHHHHHHHHMIPNILIFTHSIHLLRNDKDTGILQQEPPKMSTEDLALKRNVLNSIQYHSNAKVLFWTDDDCFESIGRVMRMKQDDEDHHHHHHHHDNEKEEVEEEDKKREQNAVLLQHYFQQESHGMYKADICRGAALYEHGGLYMDIDLQVRMSLWDVIETDTTFVVPFVHKDSNYPGSFFQAFIGTTPHNPIIKQYLTLFLEYYQGRLDIQGPLGVLLLRKAHDQIVGKPIVLQSAKENEHYLEEKNNKKKMISLDRNQKLQYMMEVKYDKRLFPHVPPPTWGTRRACHFVVVSIPPSTSTNTHSKKPDFLVPFYSRTSGSRMCAATADGRQ